MSGREGGGWNVTDGTAAASSPVPPSPRRSDGQTAVHCHDHDHDSPGARHPHAHGHAGASRKRLLWTLVLAGGYLIAEVIGGWLSNSLALLADAGHMFSDVASLGLSAFAVWIADRPAGSQRTFGFYRAEILAALINGTTLIAVSGLILIEAWHRLADPQPVQAPLMMGVAIGGLVVNLAGLAILHGGRHDSLNVRGAWLHVLSDALGSVAAIGAALMIQFQGWTWADPAMSAVIAVLVIYSAWRLLAESVWVLMEGAPRHIKVDELETALQELRGVLSVHDLHVWTITSGLDALACHVVTDGARPYDELLSAIRHVIHDRFGIDHVTVQIEPEGFQEPSVPI